MKHIFLTHEYHDSRAKEIALALRSSCRRVGFHLSTPFDTPSLFTPDVPGSTFEYIKNASLVVAVLAERSDNVLLELGYALGMAKPVILVTDVRSDLPLDLSGVEAIDYRTHIEEIVRSILRNLQDMADIPPYDDIPSDLTEMLRLRFEYPERFERIPYYAFETALKEAFEQRGYSVHQADPATDYGFDFKLKRRRKELLVEVKKNSLNNKVSIAAVQQLLGAVHAYEVPKALLICSSEFTDSARGFAARHAKQLSLWTMNELDQFVHDQIPASKLP